MSRINILRDALDGRIAEVEGYQINVDNYLLAIAHIDGMAADDQAELAGFRAELDGRLAAELHQQKRAKVMLAVIEKQLEAL